MKTDPIVFAFGCIVGASLGLAVTTTRDSLPGVVGVQCPSGARYIGDKVSYSAFLEDTWDIIVPRDPNELSTRSTHIMVSRGCWPIMDPTKIATDLQEEK